MQGLEETFGTRLTVVVVLAETLMVEHGTNDLEFGVTEGVSKHWR